MAAGPGHIKKQHNMMWAISDDVHITFIVVYMLFTRFSDFIEQLHDFHTLLHSSVHIVLIAVCSHDFLQNNCIVLV